MKREFLQNFMVGDQPLTKEIIDAIMAENGRDIEETKKSFSDYETIKDQLAKAQETIKGFEGQDIEGVRKAAKDWEDKYNQAIADHKKAMDDRDFSDRLNEAIGKAKGRNTKAIQALLDVEKLKESKDQATDINTALEALKKESGYLFETEQTPPPYAGGTGRSHVTGGSDGVTAAFAALNPGLKIE